MTSVEPNGRLVVNEHDEDDRYHRQSLISWWDQSRLRQASVLVVGAGALGNELVKNLVLIGVGRIIVADMDVVENSNLARCVFFRECDEGESKATVLAARAAEANREVEVIPLVGDVRLAAGLGVFREMDLVLGGLDNREARLFVNQACWKTSTPWIDGAIEGLMGMVRVFVPPESACYECTMNERDHELLAARRTCALLTREEMLAGRVPTTATTASVIAGIQVQEAVRLLHQDRLGPSPLVGAGLQFVGLTHDSYVVRYDQRDDCYSHDTYELDSASVVDPNVTFGTLLALGRAELGYPTVLELEQELAIGAECGSCGHGDEFLKPVDALTAGSGVCPNCGNQWRLEFTHSVDDSSPLLDLGAADVGLPPGDVVVARNGSQRRFFLLTGKYGAVGLLREATCT
jgi:molybdopterin/thiamine biosynthesis adenylyltransferase